MSQKTNLNISPYYDDFDKAKNYYRTLFKPGFPVQARELTGLQSILQNQIESFGSHIFKDGSMVIPGGITYDSTYFSCKVNADHLGIDVSIYLDALINNNDGLGTKIKGQNSLITARIVNYILPPTEGVDDIVIFVKYGESDVNNVSQAFPNDELLILEENVTYGNTTLTEGSTILTLISDNASATGTSVGIERGVYYIRGTFVDVPKSLVILEPFSITPSYRVGFDINEEIITASDDDTLNDNAKGFTNFAAPGADRLKISVQLTKKALLDYSNDSNFVELLRISKGQIKKLEERSVYNHIKDYFAQRTYDESGDYSVKPFSVSLQNSLNDEMGSNGKYTSEERTDKGAIPTDDLMCVNLSSGRAYVKGYDVNVWNEVLDVEKPRDTKNIKAGGIDFRMGSILKVHNSEGMPKLDVGGDSSVVDLYNGRKGSSNASTGTKIGEARVYNYALSDAPYSDSRSEWDLHLFDIQTYTRLQISNGTSAPTGTRVRGISSGATGYVSSVSSNEINVYQTTGQFVVGEQLKFNESDNVVGEDNSTSSIVKIWSYTTDDIKSVYQASANSGLTGSINFVADSVLYGKILPNFTITDQLDVEHSGTGTAKAKCLRRRFSGSVGINTDAIIEYQFGEKIVYNRVDAISADGSELTLKKVEDLDGTNIQGTSVVFISGETPASGLSTSSPFRVKVPRILNLGRSGLYSKLPKENISTVDLSDSNLTISRQATNQTITATGIQISVDDLMSGSGSGNSVGISTALFEPFDAERYSIVYSNGKIAPLKSHQVEIVDGGFTAKFTGLVDPDNQSPVVSGTATVNATLKKIGLSSKGKNYIRSSQLEVTKTAGVTTTTKGLEWNPAYGLRIEDHEISLNVPDAVKIVSIYESTNKDKPTFDKLKFVSGLALDNNTFIGEKIKGVESRAIGQIVERTENTVSYVHLNDNEFKLGEKVVFNESNIESNLQEKIKGDYVDRTNNYALDKGQRKQYYDYSRIVRKNNSSIPSNKLLIVFDYYESTSTSTGDFFTVNSYSKDRYTKDIPIVGGVRATDVLDFRPKVIPFVPGNATGSDVKSPFVFANRKFETTTKYSVAPNESTVVGYSYYLPRIDKLVINKLGQVKLVKGVSADNPAPPTELGDSMEVAEITLSPYLYNLPNGARIRMYDNRRFTMRDIGKIEKRVSNLEVMTSLTALELDTKAIQVTDSNGVNRFKTGFVVNDFKNRDFIDFNINSGSRCDVDVVKEELISAVDFWSLKAELALNPDIDRSTADLESNVGLLDPNCQKSGDIITLKYDEVQWLNQPQASRVENVNPFMVSVFQGAVYLDPPSDNWVRTIYLNDYRTESTGAKWVEHSTIVGQTVDVSDPVITEVEVEPEDRDGPGWWEGNHRDVTTTITTTTETEYSFTNVLENDIYREFDYVESVKVSGTADRFMRSRNVAFNANGLKAFTKHIHKLDSGTPDIFPKIIKIEMAEGSQGFTVGESVIVILGGMGGKITGVVRAAAPNHKYGQNTPDIEAGISLPVLPIEFYLNDPFDRTLPAPGATYSPTSTIFNCDIESLAHDVNLYGYVVVGATLIGESSGAQATVTNVDLISDKWGDLQGSFFFRNAQAVPTPPKLFFAGTKTFRLTANTTGEYVPIGSTAHASDATGTYTATGTVITQDTATVGVRNPSEPAQRSNETVVGISTTSTTERIEAPYRDPIAQSFTVDETGAFLSSVDVYFNRISTDNSKLFVELRTMELGTPTNWLVQDFAQVSVHPDNIRVSKDASIPTNIKFPSPIYLEAGKEYALVFLAPSSIEYEMWIAHNGEKNVTPPTGLPATTDDSTTGQVTQTFLNGSLFKSQNGSIWTPTQKEDLKFTLYKAEFVPQGTVTLHNSSVEAGNENTQSLLTNPITTLPRKLIVPVTGITATTITDIPVGRKISTGELTDNEDKCVTGIIEARGGAPTTGTDASASTVEVITVGDWSQMDLSTPKASSTAIEFESVNGIGSNLEAKIEIEDSPSGSGNIIATLSDVQAVSGQTLTGFQVGEVLRPKQSSLDSSNLKGTGLTIAIKSIVNTTIDTLFLTDVQGEKFVANEKLIHYGASNDTRTFVEEGVAKTSAESTVNGDMYNGNVMKVAQYNHAHHGSNNKIKIKGVEPDTATTTIEGAISESDTQVSVASTDPVFARFAGISSDRGFALINNEVVSYIVGENILSLDGRGLNNTVASSHSDKSIIQPYEINGMSLTMVNTTHDITSNSTLRDAGNIDNYFLELDRGIGSRATGRDQFSFATEKAVGGKNVGISQNHQFSNASAKFNVITPGKGTRASSSFRTVSGTSADGNEVSFLDQGFEPTILNETTFFPTPRMVCSKVNEVERLTTLPDNKSLTLKVDMTSSDPNLSPVIDIKNATFILGRNKINNPIGADNYATDSRSTQLSDDPHGSIFVSKKVTLAQPATSLKVLVAANRQAEADFRVYYRLYTADSSEVVQSYRPFPGYKNMIDIDGDGFGDQMIDIGMCDGRPDSFVRANGQDDFSEYQFTADDLEQFSGFSIKIVMSSTNECVTVRLKDFRAIALA